MSGRQVVAGLDGGGTSTGLCCMDAQGAVISTGAYGPLNVNGTDQEVLRSTLRDAVAHLARVEEQGDTLVGMTIATAGISNPRCRDILQEGLRAAGYAGPLDLRGDQEAALRGAVGPVGAVLIAGTGSICHGRNAAGHTARAGGWGYLLDDAGSGYALGRDILRAVLRAQDGREAPTVLSDMVKAHLGVNSPGELVGKAYDTENGKATIASLAPLLEQAWDQGDPAAQRITAHAAEELAQLCTAVLNRLSLQAGTLALAGGVLLHTPALQQAVKQILRQSFPELQVISPRRDAAWGAADLAREHYLG